MTYNKWVNYNELVNYNKLVNYNEWVHYNECVNYNVLVNDNEWWRWLPVQILNGMCTSYTLTMVISHMVLFVQVGELVEPKITCVGHIYVAVIFPSILAGWIAMIYSMWHSKLCDKMALYNAM